MSRSAELGSARKDPSNQTPGVLPDGAALRTIQRRRKRILRIGVVVLLVLVAGSQAMAERQSELHDMIEATGLFAIGLCIFGRGWCSLYIGGRKKTELVTTGPYSSCRNPLYVFNMIGAFGVGAQTGSVVLGCLFAGLCWMVFRNVVAHEEALLSERFGKAFRYYQNTVPRFRPTWFRWRDEVDLLCKPALFLTTTRDAMWFLAAGPIFEGIKLMQEKGWLTPLIHLP